MSKLDKMMDEQSKSGSANAGFGLAAANQALAANSKAEAILVGLARRQSQDGKSYLQSVRTTLNGVPCSGYGIAVTKVLEAIKADAELTKLIEENDAIQPDAEYDVKIELPLKVFIQFGAKTENAAKKVVLDVKSVTVESERMMTPSQKAKYEELIEAGATPQKAKEKALTVA